MRNRSSLPSAVSSGVSGTVEMMVFFGPNCVFDDDVRLGGVIRALKMAVLLYGESGEHRDEMMVGCDWVMVKR